MIYISKKKEELTIPLFNCVAVFELNKIPLVLELL